MKKIATIILAMSAILSLTACGKNTSEQQSSPTSQLTSQATSGTGDTESTVTSKPESTATSEPESTVTSKPESTATSEPESTVTSKPESTATSDPESTATSDPESSVTSDPESSVTSDPESTATSNPESSVTSKPESSVEVKADTKPESTARASALPLKEYPAGSYFTNDGKPCTDHDDCNWDKPCNCVNFDNSIQSVGFAKYAYFKVTGRHVYEADKTEINADINEQTARAELKGLPCGTYITVTQKSGRPHAMAVISTDDNGITVYQANYGGGCVVSTMTFSWKQFAEYFPYLEYYAK